MEVKPITQREFLEQALGLILAQLILLHELSQDTKIEPLHKQEITQTMLSLVLFAADELEKLVNGDTENGSANIVAE